MITTKTEALNNFFKKHPELAKLRPTYEAQMTITEGFLFDLQNEIDCITTLIIISVEKYAENSGKGKYFLLERTYG